MSHSNPPPEVIIINDSDPEDCSQFGATISSALVDGIPGILSTADAPGSGHPATSRRGKSESMPVSCRYTRLTPHTEAPIRPRSTRSTPHNVIEIHSDESSNDMPPLKRARTDRLTPQLVESPSDGGGARDRGLQVEPRNERTETYTVLKVDYGTAVELDHIVPPRLNGVRKDYIWVTARRIAQIQQKYEKAAFPPSGRRQSHIKFNPPITLQLSPVTASFWMAGGAINRIIQKPGCIAISSATSGGQPYDPEATAQPHDCYNREGTLQIWQDGDSKNQSIILHGHCVIESPGQPERPEPTCLKCYTVNNISFDPNRSHLMTSAGNNGSIQLWKEGKKVDDGCYNYPRAPYDVVYRERDSLMAVTCMNGSVYVHQTHSNGSLGDLVELRVVPPTVQHSAGAIVWGQCASADTLFASSEPQNMTDYSGYHVAFDPDQGRRAYEFDAKESGDSMALDADGARLALCTAAYDYTHSLRLYDVRRKNGQRPVQEIQLDPFDIEPREGEVTAVTFSPDGLLLAVARSDDELHLYDSRFMGRHREPMRRFMHWGEDCCMGGDRWGIADAVWVDGWCGRGLGVVTGGSDGCVRFWDVRRSADDILNGEVVARPNSDIGHFSVGDPYNGEKPLVVGDNGGRVYVYDHASACNSTR